MLCVTGKVSLSVAKGDHNVFSVRTHVVLIFMLVADFVQCNKVVLC